MRLTRRRGGGPRRCLAMVAALAVLAGAARAQEARSGPRELVADTVAEVTRLLKDDRVTRAKKRSRFQEILDNHLHMDRVAESVLDEHWHDLDRDEQRRFKRLFRQRLATIYWGRVDEEEFDRIEVEDAAAEPDSETAWRVETRVVAKSREDTEVDFLLRSDPTTTGATDGAIEWKIVDLEIDGASQTDWFGDQYKPVLAEHGPDHLLGEMERQVEQAQRRVESGEG